MLIDIYFITEPHHGEAASNKTESYSLRRLGIIEKKLARETSYLLNCKPNSKTDAAVEITIAAAAENPFMMLSVYFTTTEVYNPPRLANTVEMEEQ